MPRLPSTWSSVNNQIQWFNPKTGRRQRYKLWVAGRICHYPLRFRARTAYPVWAYYAYGRQCRCQDDPVSLPSSGPEKTTRSFSHHVAQHRPTGFKTTPPYAPEAADLAQNHPLWRMMSTYGATQSYSCMPETTTTTNPRTGKLNTPSQNINS